MKKDKVKSIFKKLSIDMLMVFLFSLLIGFAFWLVWMYFLRGPIEIETRGYVSKTLKGVSIQPADVEKYTVQHFHNLDDAVLKGIAYPSNCVTCHGDYPHNKTVKVRAFFNAHSWFIACEVCHRENEKQESVIYKWLDNDNDIALNKLQGEPGMYDARIVPFLITNKKEQRLDNLIDDADVIAYMNSKDKLNVDQKKKAMQQMHQVLRKKPVFCDQCHTEDSMLDFKDLLYSENMGTYLKNTDIGTMIKGYKVFYLPNVFGQQKLMKSRPEDN